MRSHGSSRSHSSRSSHRSSMSHHHSSMSSHRSTMSRHHSSLASRRHTSSLHSHMRRRNGISNAHAFAVGKATGVNINGSAMGAHGAALHHSRQMRRDRIIRNTVRRTTGGSRVIRNYSNIGKSGFNNSTSSANSRRRRYTLNLSKNGFEGKNDINPTENFAGTAFLIFALMMLMSIISFIMFIAIGMGFRFLI